MAKKFVLSELSARLAGAWEPLEVERVNEFVLRLAKFEGRYNWHVHPHSEELFLVLRGKIKIETRSGEVVLSEGEGAKIPAGEAHCPVALEPSLVLLFEPAGLKSLRARS